MSNPSSGWTVEQIVALAPDAQVAKNARALAQSGKWQNLGRAQTAVWGELRSSGIKVYQVAVDTSVPAFKCNCPSRKRPCKHAVGLFLMARSEQFADSPPPEWVAAWLQGRQAAAQRKTRAAQAPIADAKAQARRVAQREKRVKQGLEALALWMDDLVRQGLANLSDQPRAFWETPASRLVDAQAPGLARRVRDLESALRSGQGWPGRLLAGLGRIHLLLEAYERLDTLPPDMQELVRQQIGWSQDQAALLARPGQSDEWLVVGVREGEQDRLRFRRTWLWGAASRRAALILDFAAPGRPFEGGPPFGVAAEAELVFWPGTFPLRAAIKQAKGTRPVDVAPAGYSSFRAAMAAWGQSLARDPWLEHFLMPIENVLPAPQGGTWVVQDAEGCRMPLSQPALEGWRLMGLSGGRPVTLTCEWDGERLIPLSVWADGELARIGGAS